jgi:hypothetical protein
MSGRHDVPVSWAKTSDPDCPFTSRVDGHDWVLRLGDFPAEPLYTLIVDGIEAESFDEWPAVWTRP